MTQLEIIQVLAGFIGSMGFAVLFNIRGERLIAAAIGGLLSWLLFVVGLFSNLAITSAYAEITRDTIK